jgi:hypothetical protein
MKNSSDTIGNRTCDLPVEELGLNQLRHRVRKLKFSLFTGWSSAQAHAWQISQEAALRVTADRRLIKNFCDITEK